MWQFKLFREFLFFFNGNYSKLFIMLETFVSRQDYENSPQNFNIIVKWPYYLPILQWSYRCDEKRFWYTSASNFPTTFSKKKLMNSPCWIISSSRCTYLLYSKILASIHPLDLYNGVGFHYSTTSIKKIRVVTLDVSHWISEQYAEGLLKP